MITAWIVYYNHKNDTYYFEERTGTSFTSQEPEDWGLSPADEIILVLQQAQFLGAWLCGERKGPN